MSRSVSPETKQKNIMTTSLPTPKHGGIHPVYGLYIGWSSLNQAYEDIGKLSYASQCSNKKGLASIKQHLMNAQDSSTSLKLDGKLEALGSSFTEMGKERFLTLLQRRVEEHGQQTFYFFNDMVVTEFHLHNDFGKDHSSFDFYKQDEILLSRLVVQSYLSTSFFENLDSLPLNPSVLNKPLNPWRYTMVLWLILTSLTVAPSKLTHLFDTFEKANSVSGIVGLMPIIKNVVAEFAVHSVSNMACALLLHASMRWKGRLDSSYWAMAVAYATYL
jgi:hypothetical protein